MKPYMKLGAGVIGIIVFIWVIVPFLMRGRQATVVKQFIEKRDINAGALFYTDSPEAGRAIYYMQKNDIVTYESK